MIMDITNGIARADSIEATPFLGATPNPDGSGDVAWKNNGNGTGIAYVLGTNNGIGAYTFVAILAGIASNDSTSIPASFVLGQNYPNPFNPTTVIDYQLPKDAHVTIKVYDVLGRVVATLVDGEESAGYHEVSFNGWRFASGVYFYRFTAQGVDQVKKMLLVK